jgi:hypothetical protein
LIDFVTADLLVNVLTMKLLALASVLAAASAFTAPMTFAPMKAAVAMPAAGTKLFAKKDAPKSAPKPAPKAPPSKAAAPKKTAPKK